MTKRMTQLLEDARKAGYSIKSSGGVTYIIKRVGRWKKPQGIYIYEDGCAFDASADLRVAKGLRSYQDMRGVLGI